MTYTYVDAIDDAAVADVERMHDEDENDRFEDGFAGVLKHETNEEKLRGDDEEDLSGGDAKDEKRNDYDDHNDDGAGQLVELLDRGFGVVQRMCQCLPLDVGMNLHGQHVEIFKSFWTKGIERI